MRILILCTGNSCRSQMAHGFLQSFDKNIIVCSCGTSASGKLNQEAVKKMAEVNIDISGHKSDSVEKYINQEWDYVITVCSEANESCPAFTGKVKNRIHIGFDDPSHAIGTLQFIENKFRIIRDEIQEKFYDFYVENILYKDILNCSDEVKICHCSGITLGQIKTAKNNGYKTIQTVRDYFNKNITGKCNIYSPNKKCCHKRFQKILDILN